MSTVAKSVHLPRTTERTGSAPEAASVDHIRSQFPALNRWHGGKVVAYFDGPGGTQVPRIVAEAVTDYLYHHNANTHWKYPTSAETDAMFANARQAMADFLNGDSSEIIFGANATSLAFHVSRALARQLSSDDEVVITELDHHANVGPWQALARESGCKLQVVRMNTESGELNWSDFEQKVNDRTKLVAVGAASNALGTISDVRRAAKLAKSVGALTFVDAVHYAPHNLADVRAMECDFLMCSAYKFYGPHVGVLWCRRALLESLRFAKLEPAPNTAPERAETGTLNHEGVAGTLAAVDFLASLGQGGTRRDRLASVFAALHQRGSELTEQLWNRLSEINGITLYGPPPTAARTSTVAFTVRGVQSSEVARRLAEQALFLSHGNFYAATVIERLSLAPEGLVRAGCACYTTSEEVARLVGAIREIAHNACHS
jgi:cysteine desulfurase family protein (TIGR01976 family)